MWYVQRDRSNRQCHSFRLISFSLRDKAKFWHKSLAPGATTTWEELAQSFKQNTLHRPKTAKLRNDITTFTQCENESLYKTWKYCKDLLRKCHHHDLPIWFQIQTFSNDLDANNGSMINIAIGGALMSKTLEAAAHGLLEELKSNNYQWSYERVKPKLAAGVM